MQVASENSMHNGMLFIIGDIRGGRAHGFYMNNRKREYITVNTDEIVRIGRTKISSREPCSPKWLSDNA